MKLRRKLWLTGRALIARRTAWVDRFGMALGLLLLPGVPLAALGLVVDLAFRHYLSALTWLVVAPMCAVMWGHAWRLAVDAPMAFQWYWLPGVQLALAITYTAAAVVMVLARQWGWAALETVAALAAWRWHPDGGGGWDFPVDVPNPDPSTRA